MSRTCLIGLSLMIAASTACGSSFEDGQAAACARDWDKAIARFSDCVRTAPTAEIYTLRGNCHDQKGNYELAVADYSAALRLDSDFENAILARGISHVHHGKYDDGVRDLTRAIQLQPNEPEAFAFRARAFYETAQFEKAINDYSEAIRLSPLFRLNSVSNRGCLYLKTCQYEMALKDFSRIIKLYPDNCIALAGRAAAYSGVKDFDRALADASAFIRLDGRNARAFGCRGNIYMECGDRERALADFTEMVELEPRNTEALLFRAKCYAEMKQFDKAIADCTQAIEFDPKNTVLFGNRATFYRMKKDIVKAVADYSTAIILGTDAECVVYSLLNRANCYRELGYIEEACKGYAEVIRLDASNVWARFQLAEILSTYPESTLRDGKRAAALSTKACELSQWKDPNCLTALADACAECGDFDRAVKLGRDALAIGFKIEARQEACRARLKKYEAKEPYRLTLTAPK